MDMTKFSQIHPPRPGGRGTVQNARVEKEDVTMRSSNPSSRIMVLFVIPILLAAVGCNMAAARKSGVTETAKGITPTVPHESGSGELLVQRVQTGAVNNANYTHSVEATVPLTIQHSTKNSVFEVKGKGVGKGSIQLEHPNAQCSSTWAVDFTISGTLVPYGGLIAEPDEGCYMQLHITEDWEIQNVSCDVDIIGKVVVTQNDSPFYFGPLKLPLVDDEQTGDQGSAGGTFWDFIWTIKNLDVPLETGCIAGQIIK
jgi:hypothetical protein